MKISNYKKSLFYLIAFSTIVRCFLACILEFDGEEAYYRAFALYPKLSHLDQPPMIGWLIQLFTNNLSFNSEFATRLVSIIIGSVNTWIIFILGKRMRSERAGLFAAILYTTSIYCSIVTGTLISPDTPQSIFILLSIYFLHEGLIIKYEDNKETRAMCAIAIIMSGVFIGFALLSKFSSGLIWIGALIYIALFDRSVLKRPHIYISIIISLIILSPVIIWNMKYNYIGFRYIGPFNSSFIEICRQIIYSNPVNILIAFYAIISFKRFRYLKGEQYRLFICLSLPFLILGHISAGFYPLIMLSGAYIDTKYRHRTRFKLPLAIKRSFQMFFFIVLAGTMQIFTGLLNLDTKKAPDQKIGASDSSIDRYGWKKLSKEFTKLRSMDVALGDISGHAYIVSGDYLSAAHYDYYLARPNGIIVRTIGNIKNTRKYAFTTQDLGGFKIGESAYYIESSRDSTSLLDIGRNYYGSVEKAKIIYIYRFKEPVVRYTIYRFKEMKVIPPEELISVPEIYRR